MPQGWTVVAEPQAPPPAGNIDLFAQPKVKNPDGSTSTVDSVGVNIDGKEYLLPTVTPDGRHFTGPKAVDQAVAEFKKTGRHLGVFSSVAESNAYAEQLHNDYAAGKYDKATTTAPKGWTPIQEAAASPSQQPGANGPFIGPAKTQAIAAPTRADAGKFTGIGPQEWSSLSPKERQQRMDAFLTSVGYLAIGDIGARVLTTGARAVGRAATPYVAPALRSAAAAIEQPLVNGAVGAVTGYAQGGVPGAVKGGAAGLLFGATAGTRTARTLRKAASRIDPPPVRVNPNTAASQQIVRGMSEAGATPPPLPATAAPVAAPVASRAVVEASPVPPVASTSQPAGPPLVVSAPQIRPATPTERPPSAATSALSPQRIQNELGLVARRTGAKLSEAEYSTAAELVAQGKSPAEAIASTIGERGRTLKATFTAAESKVYTRLRDAGKNDREALAAIEAQRALAARLGTPSSESVRQAVKSRNETGQWKPPTGYPK